RLHDRARAVPARAGHGDGGAHGGRALPVLQRRPPVSFFSPSRGGFSRAAPRAPPTAQGDPRPRPPPHPLPPPPRAPPRPGPPNPHAARPTHPHPAADAIGPRPVAPGAPPDRTVTSHG